MKKGCYPARVDEHFHCRIHISPSFDGLNDFEGTKFDPERLKKKRRERIKERTYLASENSTMIRSFVHGSTLLHKAFQLSTTH